MTFQVILDANVKKQIGYLRKLGGRSALVADHAESLIERFTFEKTLEPRLTGRRTRHGEARIKNCIKFDLIDGYRLIGIRRGTDFVFLYIGTHDQCDRWLRNNSKLGALPEKHGREALRSEESGAHQPGEKEEPESNAIHDDYLDKEIDQKILRQVFCGLTGH